MALITDKTYPQYPIPRPLRRYPHKKGDVVHFRGSLGKLNNEIMGPVIFALGSGPLTVTETGDGDQVQICNQTGKEDVVHGVWLIPISVNDSEDYPIGQKRAV